MNCILFPEDAPLTLSPDSPKLEHIKKVLRAPEGGEIYAGHINGALNVCKISYTPDGGAILTPARNIAVPRQLNVSIAVSYARPQIAQRLLFESACFGVKKLVFYPASKGEAGYAKSSLYTSGEYLKWFERGAEQACATQIPEFEYAESLERALEMLDDTDEINNTKLAPDIYEAEASFAEAFSTYNPMKDDHTSIVLGSERGWTNADRQLLRDNQYVLVSLGERVLRTDTALIATLSLIANL